MTPYKFQKYDKYKISESERLDKVPESWKISRIKELGILSRGVDLARDAFQEGEYPVYGSNGVIGYHSKYTTKGPGLTVGRSGSVGEVNFVEVNFWAHNTALYLQQSFKNNVKYIYYRLLSLDLQSLSAGSAVGTLNRNVIHRLITAIPPLSEQITIAAYLDTKTGQIDRKIDLLTQKAGKYAELKQALINETVTRGLDKSVPKKDSGVEWIGEVPAHWTVTRIADLAIQNKYKNIGVRETNLLSLSYGKIIRKDINTSFGLLPASFETYQILKPGTLVLRLTDLQNDQKSLRVGLAREKGIITSAYLGLNFNKKVHSIFAYYLLHVYDLSKVFYWFGGGLRSTMRYDDVKVIPFIIPSFDEQVSIAEYLDQKTAKIDHIIQSINTQIGHLKELRKTLINDVVTGKLKVTEGETA